MNELFELPEVAKATANLKRIEEESAKGLAEYGDRVTTARKILDIGFDGSRNLHPGLAKRKTGKKRIANYAKTRII